MFILNTSTTSTSRYFGGDFGNRIFFPNKTIVRNLRFGEKLLLCSKMIAFKSFHLSQKGKRIKISSEKYCH